MRNYIDTKDLSTQVKVGLQICHKGPNQGKYPEREYRLFNNLAELYLQKENVRKYPEVVVIYQYLKKLVEKHFADKGELALLDKKIKEAEQRFIGSEVVKKHVRLALKQVNEKDKVSSIVQKLYQNVNNLLVCSSNRVKADSLATSEGINQFLVQVLGNSAYIIHPELASRSSTAEGAEGSFQEAVSYIKTINEILKGKQTLDNPVVIMINTQSDKMRDAKEYNAKGGRHWQTCVILPRIYQNPLGVTINNPNERVYFIDSYYQSQIPELLKGVLKHGLEYSFEDEEQRKVTYRIPALCFNAEFINCGPQQQSDGYDCGWWVAYNALMVVLTGKVDFLNQFQQRSREGSYVLRSLFPNIGENIYTVKQHNFKEIPPTELAAIRKAMEESFKALSPSDKKREEDKNKKELDSKSKNDLDARLFAAIKKAKEESLSDLANKGGDTHIPFRETSEEENVDLKKAIEEIDTLIASEDYAKAKTKIKKALQFCYRGINQSRYAVEEYELFIRLGDIYLNHEKIYDIPKAGAIYQYVAKLIEKQLNGDKERLALVLDRIRNTEIALLKRTNAAGSYFKAIDIENYKNELQDYRNKVKERLKKIEDLGIIKNQEELDEKGLEERAKHVEGIYMDIRKFFIGTEDEKTGLVNRLIKDCIKQLGGLPRVGKDYHECVYAVFGMGSLSLGTMTPWSDLELGILIEEGLTKEEDVRVKEYFRLLTTLLHVKVIHFGETLLRMMGVEELNNFKLTEKSDAEHNWFYDDLITPGFSFDGPHWHACKTPLGRAEGYKKPKKKEKGMEESCVSYELIGDVEQFMKFYDKDAKWVKEDPQLIQGLGHIVLIIGESSLLYKFQQGLESHKEIIESLAFNLLKEDCNQFNPFRQVLDIEKEGQILKVKKEMYRFPDRIIVALGSCLGAKGKNSWELIENLCKELGETEKQDLSLALSIATEIRLRTYANNNGQKEDLSAVARYELKIKELDENNQLEKIFYFNNNKVLYAFYYKITKLNFRIGKLDNIQQLKAIRKISITEEESLGIMGYIYYRFSRYYEAIKIFELEKLRNDQQISDTLGNLYYLVRRDSEALNIYMKLGREATEPLYKARMLNNVGSVLENLDRSEDAIKYHQISLAIKKEVYDGDHYEIATSLANIGFILEKLGKSEMALDYLHRSLAMYYRIYNNSDNPEIAGVLNSIGMSYDRLCQFKEAVVNKQKSLAMYCRIYKGNHAYIAECLNNIGNTVQKLGRYEEGLRYHQASLSMMYEVYKNANKNIAGVLDNIGTDLRLALNFEEALKYHMKALRLFREVHKIDISDTAVCLNNIGIVFLKLERYEEALGDCKEGLEIMKRIYNNGHPSIAQISSIIGDILSKLNRFKEALLFYNESLEIYRKFFKSNNIFIIEVLNDISETLFKLRRYEEALNYNSERLVLLRQIYPIGHPSIQLAQKRHLNCIVLLANNEILIENLNKALAYYGSIGANIKVWKLNDIALSYAFKYWQAGDVLIASSCFEALSEKLSPQDRGIKHNLACAYHVKAFEERSKNIMNGFEKYLQKARETFERALNLESSEEIHASLYVEYAMFLLMHHDPKNEIEYSIIIANIMYAIELKEDGSGLSYSQIDKSTTVAPLQELLNRQKEITVKPHLLAYYLLVKVHCLHSNVDQAEEVLKGFRTDAQLLKGSKDENLAQYLLDWCYRELKLQKLQQVVISQLTDLLESGMYAMAESRNITTVALSQSLPHNHIGIIWDYYSEHSIMCVLKHELRQIFNSTLSSSSEVLKAALSQNDTHVDIIMDYLDEEIVLSENFETRVITARNENKVVMKEL